MLPAAVPYDVLKSYTYESPIHFSTPMRIEFGVGTDLDELSSN